jgi:hypothetical protein
MGAVSTLLHCEYMLVANPACAGCVGSLAEMEY